MPTERDKPKDEIKKGERAAMFRIKKGAGNGSDAVSHAGSDAEMPAMPPAPTPATAEAEAPEPKPVTRRVAQPPVRSMATAQHLDLTRRPGELAGPTARSELQLPAVREKTLLVGQDVEFAGEIKSCQKLIIEGIVQVSSANCRHLQVSPTGVFHGSIEVADAEILGQFDGELIARERLIIRASGRVSGKIRYGSIIVDSGGHIAGDIGALEAGAPGTDSASAAGSAAPDPTGATATTS